MQKSLGKKLISEAFLRELRLLSQPLFVCLRRDANRSDWNEDISYSQAGEDTYKLKVGRDYEEKYD